MGAKGGSTGTRNYYGTCAGIVALGQLDFIWGLMVNNSVVWPANVHPWNSKLYQQGAQVVWTDGNVYKALANTWVQPPNAPWTLYAVPYVAGAWAAGSVVIYGGNVWRTVAANAVAPPAILPAAIASGVWFWSDYTDPTTHWTYVSTPHAYTGATNWPANSIVSYEGRIYKTSADTRVQPPGAPWSLYRVDRATSPNPLKLTVPNYGDAYLYWGTPDQVLDVGNEGTLSALGHPPYRNRAVLVLKNFLFGPETTTPPDVKVLAGRYPVQSVIVGDSTNADADWQVNPWCVLAEILTHPVFGLGLPNAMLDATSWQAEADRCAANPGLYYISPLWTSQTKARDIVAEVLSYMDGWVRWDGGKLIAGHWPHGESAPAFDGTNTVNRDNLVDEPSWSSSGWTGTVNAVELSFRDIEAAFKSRPALASNLFNRQATGLMLSQKVDRPHIVRYDQACAWATEAAKLGGDRVAQGTSKVRAETTKVKPGDLFLLTDDVLGTSTVQRCTQRVIAAPPEGTVTLAHETERGVAPQAYSPTPTNPTANPGVKPSPLPFFQVFQMPASLAGIPNAIGCIASRGDVYEKGFDLLINLKDGTNWQTLGTQNGFGVIGKCRLGGIGNLGAPFIQNGIAQGTVYQMPDVRIYSSWRFFYLLPTDAYDWTAGRVDAVPGTDYIIDWDAGTVTILAGGRIVNGSNIMVQYVTGFDMDVVDGTLPDDIEAISDPPTLDEVDDCKYLVLAMRPGQQIPYEIMSLRSIQAQPGGGASYYYINVSGSQFGTKTGGDGAHIWTQGDYFYIIPRAALVPMTHVSFPKSFLLGDTLSLELSPFNPWQESDPTDLYDPANNPTGSVTSAQLQLTNALAPQGTWDMIAWSNAGAWTSIADFTTVFATATKFRVQFQLSSPNAAVVSASLVASLGDNQVTLWSNQMDPSSPPSRTVDFTLPSPGQWEIALVLLDAAGNGSQTVLQSGGSEVYLITADAATAPTPIIKSWMTGGGYAYNVQFGPMPAGVTVYYAVANRGFTPVPGLYAAATALGGGVFQVPVTFLQGQLVWAYCTKSGAANSQAVAFFFK